MAENPMQRLVRVASLPERRCLGLMSGTSVDGVDAALCRIAGSAEKLKLTLVGHAHYPYPPGIARRVHEATTVKELCELNFDIGRAFAEAALAAIETLHEKPAQVDLIGSHGQTVYHLPPYLAGTPSTLQIGEAAVIAERTGILTVSDFRVRDVAAGGHGAPLVPYADTLLFRAPGRVRALQNIGGIANVTVVGERTSEVFAFDTGPGNMAIDNLVRRISGGARPYDDGGALAAAGRVIPELLAELMDHPYLKLAPPKSAGREVFGDAFVDGPWARFRDRPDDLVATMTRFTAASIAKAYRELILPRTRVDEVYLSGGGCRNPTLARMLAEDMAPLVPRRLDELGLPEQAKEAAAFALLAHETLNGVAQNVPAATGASRTVVMGKISL